MESVKILDDDKDEWIFSSLKRYSNLYMFELEFPVNALEVIGETSICLSGLQAFSKKCEILQLSIPPKLFPKDIEEGLCKDRDFQIISGGYASKKILQIKPIRAVESLVACTELGSNGVTLFKLGNDNCAIIQELSKLNVPVSTPAIKSETCPGVIDTFGNRIVLGDSSGEFLYEWNLDIECPTSLNSGTCSKYTIPWNLDDSGYITKLKFWDENSISFCTSNGIIGIYDVRSGSRGSGGLVSILATKSPLCPPDPEPEKVDRHHNDKESGPEDVKDDQEPSTSTSKNIVPSPVFSFDTIPSCNKIGIIDSYGGYESHDFRMLSKECYRRQLPGFSGGRRAGIVRDRFNIEFRPVFGVESTSNVTMKSDEFIVTGLREEFVHVLRSNSGKGDEISPIFVHDGHSKNVSHALWHPHLDRLVFSASIDSMLHAWQYNENQESHIKP